MYVDILKAPSILSLSLQDAGMDIIQGIKSILKAAISLQSLSKENPKEWSPVKLTLSRITEEGSEKVYQGSTLSNYTDVMLSSCSAQAKSDLWKPRECLYFHCKMS